MNYPNGRQRRQPVKKMFENVKNNSFSNRGMSLEEDLNDTNEYYVTHNVAVVHKKPTPIQIVKVNYPKRSAAVITEAYFREASTTDYNGIYQGKYIDFEAKETNNKTSFPLANIHTHQIQHMESIIKHNGIAFMIIRFSVFGETYLLKAEFILNYWNQMQAGGRKSIPYHDIVANGFIIPIQYQPRVDYLKILDDLYF